MISFNQISVSIDNTEILKDIDLDIPTGRLSILLGKNGAGKSTLLRSGCGDLPLTKGSVNYESTPMEDLDAEEMAKYRAIVLQNSKLSFSFSALEVVLMGRIPHTRGLESSEDHDIARQCMHKMQILDLEHREYTTLSGGERQRVQLARALAQIWDRLNSNKPCYLLLDEPTSSLDIAHQHQLLALLEELAQEGVTILTILHDLNLAAQYGDQVTILKDGRKLATGPPDDIFQPHLIQQAFECPVHILNNPHNNCPLVVATSREENKTLQPIH